MQAAVLTAALNPYHPPKTNHAPLDTLLVTIGLVILILLVVVPAHIARSRENQRLMAEQPPTPSEESAASPR